MQDQSLFQHLNCSAEMFRLLPEVRSDDAQVKWTKAAADFLRASLLIQPTTLGGLQAQAAAFGKYVELIGGYPEFDDMLLPLLRNIEGLDTVNQPR